MLRRTRFALLVVVCLAAPSAARAQITVGPYSWPDATPFADTATYTGTPSFVGGASDITAAVTGYSPTTAAVNVGYPCSDGTEIVELGFTDVRAVNGSGIDIVVFDARYSSDHYEIAVRPTGGSFTTYELYRHEDQVMTGVSGPSSATLWGVEVDLSYFGLAGGTVVDAIRIKGDCATNPDSTPELDLVMAAVTSSAGCSDDADCDDGNECTADACVSGACTATPEAAGTTCSTGVCNGDSTAPACVECIDDAGCDDGNECTVDACADEACTATPEAEGTTCSDGVCNGDETDPACVECLTDAGCGELAPVCSPEGACVECLADTDCDDGNECTDDACDTEGGACTHPSLPAGTACGSGGVCDGAATRPACVECTSDADCVSLAPYCSPEGACVECLADGDCDDADECTTDTCDADGRCMHATASECGGDGGPAVSDGGVGRADGGGGTRRGSRRGGCGCRVAAPTSEAERLAWLLLLRAPALWRRRRRR